MKSKTELKNRLKEGTHLLRETISPNIKGVMEPTSTLVVHKNTPTSLQLVSLNSINNPHVNPSYIEWATSNFEFDKENSTVFYLIFVDRVRRFKYTILKDN